MVIDSSEYVVECCCKAIWQGNPLTFSDGTTGHGVVRGHGGPGGPDIEIFIVVFKQVCVGKENGECPDKDPLIDEFIHNMRLEGWTADAGTGGGADCTSPRCCKRKSRSAFLPLGKDSECCGNIYYTLTKEVGSGGPVVPRIKPLFK